jgi:hypothetical protein
MNENFHGQLTAPKKRGWDISNLGPVPAPWARQGHSETSPVKR